MKHARLMAALHGRPGPLPRSGDPLHGHAPTAAHRPGLDGGPSDPAPLPRYRDEADEAYRRKLWVSGLFGLPVPD
jgi:hypothetical protein